MRAGDAVRQNVPWRSGKNGRHGVITRVVHGRSGQIRYSVRWSGRVSDEVCRQEFLARVPDEIALRCRCGNTGSFERRVDPDLPPVVATIVSDKCPKCDDGDRGSETYFDASGRELEFGTWKPFRK